MCIVHIHVPHVQIYIIMHTILEISWTENLSHELMYIHVYMYMYNCIHSTPELYPITTSTRTCTCTCTCILVCSTPVFYWLSYMYVHVPKTAPLSGGTPLCCDNASIMHACTCIHVRHAKPKALELPGRLAVCEVDLRPRGWTVKFFNNLHAHLGMVVSSYKESCNNKPM